MRDGKIKDQLFVEGVRLVEECCRSEIAIIQTFVSDSFAQSMNGRKLFNSFSLNELELFELSDQLFKSLSDTKNSQGIVVIAGTPKSGRDAIESKLQNLKNPSLTVVLLHEINNPSNLGAIMRTSEAANVAGIILTNSSANPFSSKALRASMGSAFRLPVWADVSFEDSLAWGAANGLTSVCTDVNGKLTYCDIDWKLPRLLIFGSEAHGLTEIERDQIQECIIIPMENGVESLNLSVSTGIVLFEAKRQKTI